jgi:hypothetical protein
MSLTRTRLKLPGSEFFGPCQIYRLLRISRFSLKFQKIVQDEQDANFITRLHGGKLQIIPWPVIESEEFYMLFVALKMKLDQQPTSHHTAGEFLHTLKTLMAKLKVHSPMFFSGWVTNHFCLPNRQTIGGLCHVRSLVLIFCSRLEFRL